MLRTTASAIGLAAAMAATPAFAQSEPTSTDTEAQVNADANFCDNAFYSVDADASGSVSPEEVAERESGAYDSIDANKDGTISREEYQTCLVDRFARARADWPERESTDDEFSRIDADGSGDVTVAEYATAARDARDDYVAGNGDGWDPTAFAPAVQADERMTPDRFAAEAAITFGRLDRDQDQSLTREEWIERGEKYALDASAVNQRFDEMDSDASGDVSREEFEAQSRRDMATAREVREEYGIYGAGADQAEMSADASAATDGSAQSGADDTEMAAGDSADTDTGTQSTEMAEGNSAATDDTAAAGSESDMAASGEDAPTATEMAVEESNAVEKQEELSAQAERGEEIPVIYYFYFRRI